MYGYYAKKSQTQLSDTRVIYSTLWLIMLDSLVVHFNHKKGPQNKCKLNLGQEIFFSLRKC